MSQASLPFEDVRIELGERSYTVRVGAQLLDDPQTWQGLPRAKSAVIVTNTTVGPLYAQRLVDQLQAHYAAVHVVTLPDGEAHKDWQTLQLIFDALLREECDRKTVLFALGGGVIGDMTGFAAACYMRGVPFVQVPTTLLAQVDSSVGGKTAVNHPLGKNMIGAFYQPERVVCDLSLLASLPQREVAAGLAEVIKYGPIFDTSFLSWLDDHMEDLVARDLAALRHAIVRSCQIKAEVVGQDERESGLRAILNFGHTFGHAIEAGMGYGVWLHGEAVGCGMVMAAELSRALGILEASDVNRMRALIQRAGLPVVGPTWPAEDYLQHMRVDKKAENGAIRFVVLEGLGKAVMRAADDETVSQVLARTCAPL